MRKILGPLAIAALLLSGTDSHALRTGSSKTLTVQNGAATVGCTADVGASASLLYDADGQTATNPATCLAIPPCNAGNYLRWQGSALECSAPSAATPVAPLIVTQSHTPIVYDASATTMYMGLGGAVRNFAWSLTRLTGSAITFKNLVCQTHDIPSGGQATVTLVYAPSYNALTTATNLSVVLSAAGTNTTAPMDQDTTASIPANAYIGYKIDTTAGFTSGATYSEPGLEIYCTVERAS